MGQGSIQPATVDAAASAMEESGLIDSILGEPSEDQPVDQESEQEVEEEQAEPAEGETEQDEADEGDESDEAESDESDESESADEDGAVSIESIDQLAENLEVSKDDLLDNLTLEVVVDGEKKQVSLREAQKGYQMEADYRRKTAEVANQRREYAEKAQQVQQAAEYQHQVAAHVLMEAERELLGELNSVNFAEMQKTDPVEWATKYAQLQQRQQQIQAVKQQAQQAYMTKVQQAQEQQAQAMQEILQREAEVLQTVVPNFSEIKPDLDGYLSDQYGFTNEELTSVIDHRLVDMARKSMLYDRMQGDKKKTLKAIKAKPKMQKAAKSVKTNSKQSGYRSAKAKARKTGHIRDAAAAIENLL